MNTIKIPMNESLISDQELFDAFDLTRPELSAVRHALDSQNLVLAKQELVHHFQNRTQVQYLYDYRKLPLTSINPDEHPYFYQASLGFGGSVKEFCLFSGEKLMNNIYIRPGKERKEVPLGEHLEQIPRFSFLYDQGKRHRTIHDIFVRGQLFEYLSVLYHETGDEAVLTKFKEMLNLFFHEYAIEIENTAPNANHFVFTQDRDVMSVGWLAFSYIGLLYTRLPYEVPTDLAFELIKHIWFLGIQFRRFDTDTYRPFNHHMWERGLVPFMLGTLFPEIPEFVAMKELGRSVTCRHVKEDYSESGGYNEHSISYWSGASLGEMISRGIYLARVNHKPLLDDDAQHRIQNTFRVLALISPPGSSYPSVGDNGETLVDPILQLGIDACSSTECRNILAMREDQTKEVPSCIPMDYCDDKTGFVCARSSFSPKANYFMMSAKISCGNSGHNHMDMLSLFLTFHGQDFIGEPHARLLRKNAAMGSEHRGYLYNMDSHNTVLAYGRPVQPGEMYANWYGVYRPDSPVRDFLSNEDGMYACAYHDAYTNCRHQRSIVFHRRHGFLVRDLVERAIRMPVPHIQRWHLFPDVLCTQMDDRTLLMEKQDIQILCVWTGEPQIQFYRNEYLYPDFINKKEQLPTIIDASFAVSPHAKADVKNVEQTVLFLDITGYHLPDSHELDVIRQTIDGLTELSDLNNVLKIFPHLKERGEANVIK